MTAESLMSILRGLRSDGLFDHGRRGGTGSLSGMRRRKLPRVGVRQRLTILPLPADEDAPAAITGETGRKAVIVRLRNLGPRGLGMLSDKPMNLGGRFLLLLPRERGGVVHLLGRVCRCREADAGLWDVGTEIQLDASQAQLTGLVRSLRHAA